jgi:hypothetical protein
MDLNAEFEKLMQETYQQIRDKESRGELSPVDVDALIQLLIQKTGR